MEKTLDAPCQEHWRQFSPSRNTRSVSHVKHPTRTAGSNNTAEIISIGNELLIGHTLDTNSHWIARQFARLGWELQRVTQLRDSLYAVQSGVRESVLRKPAVLITLGGLGPTHDDMTLQGIALALHRPLKLNVEALELVKERYRQLETRPRLTFYRKKMATIPRGASPLPNPIGTAPGVKMQVAMTTMFSLPGVPSEMKAIFRRSIAPFLKRSNTTPPKEVQLRIVGIIESALAPILDEARRVFPGLYFKSHPMGRETGTRPLILLHIYNVKQSSREKVGKAAEYITKKLSAIC